MSEQTVDIQRLSPDKMLTMFSGSNLMRWVWLSVIIHAVVIFVFSVLPALVNQYVGDGSGDPNTAAVAPATDGEDEDAKPAADEKDGEGETEAKTKDGDAKTGGEATSQTPEQGDGEGKADDGKSQVEKEMKTMPDDGEIPDAPDPDIEF